MYLFKRPCELTSVLECTFTDTSYRMMSGGTGTNFNIMSSVVAENTAKVAQSVGCTGDPDSSDTIECLRKIPFENLMNVSVALARQQHPISLIGLPCYFVRVLL